MVNKDLKGDIEAAALADPELHVSDIGLNEDAEEVVFTYSHRDLLVPLKLHALVKNASSYPDSHEFSISAKFEDLPSGVENLIRRMSSGTRGMTAHELIVKLSRSITAGLENKSVAYDEEVFDSSDDESNYAEYDVGYHESDDQGIFSDDLRSRLPPSLPYGKLNPESRQRLRRDFTAMIRVGIKPKLLGDTHASSRGTFAMTIPVQSLRIPEDTLEAWDLAPSEHIVLLMRLTSDYLSLDEFINSEKEGELINFRVGKCKTNHPSLNSASTAFHDPKKAHSRHLVGSPVNQSGSSEEKQRHDDFVTNYVCAPINDLLRNHFRALLRLRRIRNLTWNQAQETLLKIQRGQDKSAGGPAGNKATHDDSSRHPDPIISERVSSALQEDFALNSEETFSLPLVAMQFALRRLARCIEFCMICHQKIKGGYEAVKPYICEDGLCLYQYMKLGLGHTVEHEVIKHPYVVDLLISFFAASISQASRTTVPSALGIKTFDRTKKVMAWTDLDQTHLWFDPKDHPFWREIRQGQQVLIASGSAINAVENRDTTPQRPFFNYILTLKLSQRISKLSSPSEVPTRSSPRRILNEDAISKALRLCGLSDGDTPDSPVSQTKRRRESPGSSDSSPRKRPRTESSVPSPGNTILASRQLAVTAFAPGSLDWETLPILPEPSWVTSSPAALRRLGRDIKEMQAMQKAAPAAELGWYVDFERMDNLFQWIVELHSFPNELALAKDMEAAKCQSIVLELRFGSTYPNSPPFVRVIRPMFLPFRQGGGGHVTEGGAICSELLTNSGWLPILSLDKVLLTVRLGLMDAERPARLVMNLTGKSYSVNDAVTAYERAARSHGWQIPEGFRNILSM